MQKLKERDVQTVLGMLSYDSYINIQLCVVRNGDYHVSVGVL